VILNHVIMNHMTLNAMDIAKRSKEFFSPSYINSDDYKNEIRFDIDVKNIVAAINGKCKIVDLDASMGINTIRIYNPGTIMTVSSIVEILKCFGLVVTTNETFKIHLDASTEAFIHKYNFTTLRKTNTLENEYTQSFLNLITDVINGSAKNDDLNQLSYSCGFNKLEIYIIKSYIAYARQIKFQYPYHEIVQCITEYDTIVKKMIDLFVVKFLPELSGNRSAMISNHDKSIAKSIDEIKNQSKVKILDLLLSLIRATIRTNCFINDHLECLAFKFNSKLAPNLPKPVPFAEIFVFSDKFEAIHLRGGKVSRGGIRWSDRGDDYRTEILGLVKTQTTKNSIIVPTGAKGGFFIKYYESQDRFSEGINCYQKFLSAMLDITDNIVSNKVVKPKNVISYDDDDPYLVVAADKGTAKFSDYANNISISRGFWLGDAFASGGSNGYDHKALGITAKGAWESVRRHFTESGVNIENQTFTAIGIGSLEGDVFGNGVTYSQNMKLIAAFNHEYIFLDPTPDPKTSYAERLRMFNAGISSWMEYNQKLISNGGGVFRRFGDEIKITPEVRNMLNIPSDRDTISPEELIRHILIVKVDLLWNGGIGTFIKAKSETHEDVCDSFNDVVRVNGSELGARIVGEGGNLGMTQLGRIEYEFSGGKLNTDAIDNSAGVDCSDHEVNIKIALNQVLMSKHITIEERNSCLAQMQDEVSSLVLRDNYLQTQAISIAKMHDAENGLLKYKNLMFVLEDHKLLDRGVEFLPENSEITRRLSVGSGLTRPEISVLLAYAKIYLCKIALKTDIYNDPAFDEYLIHYFPSLMRVKFKEYIIDHPLRKEIISTSIVNEMVNRIGITAIFDMMQIVATDFAKIAKVYVAIKNMFDIEPLWNEMDSLNGKIDCTVYYKLHYTVAQFIQRTMQRLITIYPKDIDVSNIIKELSSSIKMLHNDITTNTMVNANRQYFDNMISEYISHGVPSGLSRQVSLMSRLRSIVTVAHISNQTGIDLDAVSTLYYEMDSMFDLLWVRDMASNMNITDYWEWCLSISGINALLVLESQLCKQLLLSGKNKKTIGDAKNIISHFKEEFMDEIKYYMNFYRSIKASHAKIVVLVNMCVHRFKNFIATDSKDL